MIAGVAPAAAMIALACLAASCAASPAAAPSGAATIARPADTGPGPLRVGHRGAAGLAPENTLAAFAAGVSHGADAIEFDVRMSADGRFVVIHDPKVDKTTLGKGPVEALPYASVAALDAGARWRRPLDAPPGLPSDYGPQPVPSLEDALDFFAGPLGASAGLQVEIKFREDGSRYPGVEEAVVEGLRSRGLLGRAAVISFDFRTLAAVRALEPGLKTCALAGKAFFAAMKGSSPSAIASALAAAGADGVGLDERYLSERLYVELRAAGLAIGAWTVDDPARMRELASLGVDFITTNRPDLLVAAVPRP